MFLKRLKFQYGCNFNLEANPSSDDKHSHQHSLGIQILSYLVINMSSLISSAFARKKLFSCFLGILISVSKYMTISKC